MNLVSKIAVIVGFSSVSPIQGRAQLFYAGVRGGAGIPTGGFAEAGAASGDALLRGARPGLGYGLDAGLSLGPILGLYASTDRIDFDCQSQSCAASGKYSLKGVSGGVRMGVPLIPMIKPWVKAGITVNQLTGTLDGANGGTKFTTKKRPGYEVGAGVDLPVMTFFSLTPQVRYVRQKLKYEPPASSGLASGTREANYYTFDLCFRFRSPI